MGQRWKDYENAAERGPTAIALKVIFGVVLFGILISGIGYGLGWFGEAAKVAPLSGFGLVFPAYFTTKYWGKASQDFCFLKMTYVH